MHSARRHIPRSCNSNVNMSWSRLPVLCRSKKINIKIPYISHLRSSTVHHYISPYQKPTPKRSNISTPPKTSEHHNSLSNPFTRQFSPLPHQAVHVHIVPSNLHCTCTCNVTPLCMLNGMRRRDTIYPLLSKSPGAFLSRDTLPCYMHFSCAVR